MKQRLERIAPLGLLAWAALLFLSVFSSPAAIQLPLDPHLEGYALSNALPGLVFQDPVVITSPPGETNRLFVVERTGQIIVITDLTQPARSLFLDLSSGLHHSYLEAGLLGLAFHPGYATNRYFYVYRTGFASSPGYQNRLHDQVLRYEASPDNPNIALPESELILINQYDDNETHNAGDLHFGPDGYLYISNGDEGPPPGAHDRTLQPIDQGLFGGIMRIDVDKRPGSLPPNLHSASTPNYAIPPDNPFIGVTNYQGIDVDPVEVRTELYAIGFRNPWRMSFDPVSGMLLCGDVGNTTYEEINVIVRGGNYGWPYRSGNVIPPGLPPPPPGFQQTPPFVVYRHGSKPNEGNCVVGGIFYHGTRIPQLQGCYLFADLTRGQIWALRYTGTTNPPFQRVIADPGIAAFGRDPSNGDVLVANYHKGIIQRLVYIPPEDAEVFPLTLAETGAFTDLLSLTPETNVAPYEINLPFWSDNAIKSRWFHLPEDGARIGFRSETAWDFPEGMVWIKHFELETVVGDPASRRRLETRFVVRNSLGVYGVTYKWDPSGTNAFLVPEAGVDETIQIDDHGILRQQVWHYPSRAECLTCHSEVAGHSLGFTTAQMNHESDRDGVPVNQLQQMSQAGMFDDVIPSPHELRALAAPDDERRPLLDRVRSYFAANCIYCHRPGGLNHTTAEWDARLTRQLHQTGLLDGRLIVPHDLAGSDLLRRITTGGYSRMPPIATAVINTNAARLITDWIQSFPQLPWAGTNVGFPVREGSASATEGEFVISGTGTGIGSVQDQFQYLQQSLPANGHLIARLSRQDAPTPGSLAGVMLRQSLSSDASFAMVSLNPQGLAAFRSRLGTGDASATTPDVGPAFSWLKLVRQGSLVSGYGSPDGSQWTLVGSTALTLPSVASIGLASTAADPFTVNMARFDSVSVLSATLAVDGPTDHLRAPASVRFTASVSATGRSVGNIEFFRESEWLGETTVEQGFTWTNVPAGQHAVFARVIDSNGDAIETEPVYFSVRNQPAVGLLSTTDSGTQGAWTGVYGSEGYLVIGDATNFPPHVTIGAEGQTQSTWSDPASDLRALEKTTGPGRIAARWASDNLFTVDLDLRLGQLHRLALYFLDWDRSGRSQTVEIIDTETGVILDSTMVDDFGEGKYLVWTVRGSIRIRLSGQTDEPVLSGLFLDPDPNLPPSVSLTSSVPGNIAALPVEVHLSANASDSDGTIDRVEFFSGHTRLGEDHSAPYEFVWTDALAGSISLTARAFDNVGTSTDSDPVTLELQLPSPEVRFIGEDGTTSGNWMGTYGSDGFLIPFETPQLPPFASVITDARFSVWTGYTLDTRGLQRLDSPYHNASTWVDSEQFDLDLRLEDGRWRFVSLYFLDWDCDCRVETIELLHAETSVVLDSRQVGDFFNGKYLTWALRGAVTLRVTRLLGNAVLSGIFIDSARSYPEWKRIHFTMEELDDPLVSGDDADPDEDGTGNLFEYVRGSLPKSGDILPFFSHRIENGRSLLQFDRNVRAADVAVIGESSSDLQTWNFEGLTVLEVIGRGASETVMLQSVYDVGSIPRQFFRLRAEIAP